MTRAEHHSSDLPQSLRDRLSDLPQARLLLSDDSPELLINTRLHTLEYEPCVEHPCLARYKQRGLSPFTDYRATVPVASDFELLDLFAQAGCLQAFPRFHVAGQRERYRLEFAPLRIGVLAAGGLAPGLNMVIDAIVKRHGFFAQVTGVPESPETGFPEGLEIIGYRGGYEGLLSGESLALTHKVTDRVALDPGCCLGIRRGKKDNPRIFEALAESVMREQLDILYLIGGDGTLTAADRLAARLHSMPGTGRQQQTVRIVGAPKTMDNDIRFCDVTFGYETAVEQAVDFVRRIHDDVQACGRIGIVELFGAASGFVALDAANLSGEADDVLLPEECQSREAQVSEIDRVGRRLAERWQKKGHALLVIAEGAVGTFKHGEAASKRSNFEVLLDELYEATVKHCSDDRKPGRSDFVPNRPQHLIRSVPTLATDLRLCKTIGKLMVDSALAGFSGCAVSPWHAQFCLVPFSLASARKRYVDLADDLVSIFLDKRFMR